MVRDETRDGRRIAELLSSEIHGHERGTLGRLSVTDVDPDVEPSEFGAFAYAIELQSVETPDRNTGEYDGEDGGENDGEDGGENDGEDDGENGGETERLAEAHVHPDRVHLEFRAGQETAVETGEREGLRVRPKAVAPPRTLVFVETGAEVKPALRVVRSVAAEVLEDAG